jgi:hypothetical protein
MTSVPGPPYARRFAQTDDELLGLAGRQRAQSSVTHHSPRLALGVVHDVRIRSDSIIAIEAEWIPRGCSP